MLYRLSYAKLAPRDGIRTRDHLGDNDETAFYATAVERRGLDEREFLLLSPAELRAAFAARRGLEPHPHRLRCSRVLRRRRFPAGAGKAC